MDLLSSDQSQRTKSKESLCVGYRGKLQKCFWDSFWAHFFWCSVKVTKKRCFFPLYWQFLLQQVKSVNSHFVRVEGFIITASPSYPQDHGESLFASLSASTVLVTQTHTNVCVITHRYHTLASTKRQRLTGGKCRLVIFGFVQTLTHKPHTHLLYVTASQTAGVTSQVFMWPVVSTEHFSHAWQGFCWRDTDAVCNWVAKSCIITDEGFMQQCHQEA